MEKRDKIEKILKKSACYTIQNKAYCFLQGDRTPGQAAGTLFLGRIQNKLKRHGRVYYLLLKSFGPVFSSLNFRRCIRNCLGKYEEGHIILNLGSGPQHLHKRTDIINVDLFAFDQVDIIADACDLPIEDQSVDLIVNLAMLEHVSNPHAVTQEMCRILKPGGEVLAYVPFIVPYHAAPLDYYRWTGQGVYELFSCFDSIKIEVGCGPTSGLLYVLEEWLAILFSFGNRTIHDVCFLLFMLLLFPLKYLDIILGRYEIASNVASGFVVLAGRSSAV